MIALGGRDKGCLVSAHSIAVLRKLSLTLYIKLISFKDFMPSRIRIIRIIDFFNRQRKQFMGFLDAIGILAAFAGFLFFIYHIGYTHVPAELLVIQHLFNIILWIIVVSALAGAYIKKWQDGQLKFRIAELAIVPILLLILDARMGYTGIDWSQTRLHHILNHNLAVHTIITLSLVVEISTSSLNFNNRNTNPGLLFAFSFIFIILLGMGLLLLPNATYTGIGFTDAFFTSTSAVCVTGLIVVDTATYFTPLGQTFIIILIQIGGLGIMTFTSFFGYFFRGGASFGNEFLLKDLINEEKLGEIFNTLLKIIALTFSIEAIGALIIYSTLDPSLFNNRFSVLGFSVFHSISAFCNAGFSTLSENLYDPDFRNNYNFHYIIGTMIILGGLGFPIVFNYYHLLKHFIRNKYCQIVTNGKYIHTPKIINANTRLVMITTLILLAGGFVFFMISEYDHSLKGLSLGGKVAGAFFGSVTARTAGFNTVDMSLLAPGTILVYFFLMWIGASPASTGGGIKTTTFAVAILNFVSMSKGKDRTEVFGRELTNESGRRAFSVIFLSFLVIGLSVLILTITDANLDLTKIIFEVISAFSTVGLSLGITSQLSLAGKWVVIVTMFLGRVGTLTILVGLFRRMRNFEYSYPSEDIMIN
ncbi:MAG TPA: potassium transporter TrkG [Prolixibacteraceae bacterium]|nr:potassium transporter TrkG [Prolixibacteraceae bacterium]